MSATLLAAGSLVLLTGFLIGWVAGHSTGKLDGYEEYIEHD